MKTLYAKCSKTHQACDETLCITVSRPVVLHMHGVVEEQSDVCFCAWRCFAKWNVVEDANGECFFVKTAFNLRVLLNACSALRYPSTTDIHAAAVTVPACNKNRKVCINTVAYVFCFVRKTDVLPVPDVIPATEWSPSAAVSAAWRRAGCRVWLTANLPVRGVFSVRSM